MKCRGDIDEYNKIIKKIADKKLFYNCEIFEEVSSIPKYIFGILNYQYDNPYIYHRGVPSARNIHNNECYFIYKGHVLRYNPKMDEYEYIRYIGCMKNNFQIIVMSDLWRIMKFYGEFGLSLALLDTGHILAQFKVLLNNRGYNNLNIHYMFDRKKLLEKLSLDYGEMLPEFIIDLSEYINKSKYEIEKNNSFCISRSNNYTSEISMFNHVNSFLNNITNINENKIYERYNLDNYESINDNKILSLINSRESNHSYFGVFSTIVELKAEAFKSLIKQSTFLISNYVYKSNMIRIFCLVNNVSGIKKGYYEIKNNGEFEMISEVKDRIEENYEILNDSHTKINLSSNPVVFFVTYSINDFYTEEENIYFSHLLSGEVVHYISLMSSSYDLFSRPIKNFRDEYLQESLKLDKKNNRIMYALMIGRANSFNLKVDF